MGFANKVPIGFAGFRAFAVPWIVLVPGPPVSPSRVFALTRLRSADLLRRIQSHAARAGWCRATDDWPRVVWMAQAIRAIYRPSPRSPASPLPRQKCDQARIDHRVCPWHAGSSRLPRSPTVSQMLLSRLVMRPEALFAAAGFSAGSVLAMRRAERADESGAGLPPAGRTRVLQSRQWTDPRYRRRARHLIAALHHLNAPIDLAKAGMEIERLLG